MRAFLAGTFCYAGLQKLADPGYLDPTNSRSVVAQMQALRHSSPIGPVLGLSLRQPTLVGLLIAVGELAVGVGVLLGLRTRLAAAGGLVLSLTFFLTVSWTTTPYFYGSDIVFVFAWTVLLAFGSAGVLSLDAYLGERTRRLAGLGPAPAPVVVDADVVRALCPEGASCRLQAGGACSPIDACTVFQHSTGHSRFGPTDLDRRRLLLGTRAVGVAGIAVLAAAGATALAGRLVSAAANPQVSNDSARGRHVGRSSRRATTRPRKAGRPLAGAPAKNAEHAQKALPGTALTPASSLPVGQAKQFRNSGNQDPAWLVHPKAHEFVAFSAVCTHAGCTVGFDPAAMHFVCPCHGGTYDAQTGRVLAGPPTSPLPRIPVHVVHGQIRVD